MMRLVAILSVLSCFLVAAFGERAFSQTHSGLMAHDAWAPPSLDGASVGTAFATLMNHTDAPIEVIALHSTVAKTVELHEHVMEEGRMKMRRVEPVIIPADGSIMMKPGSYHLMLIGLKQPMKDGQSITITMRTKEGASEAVSFPVSQARLLEALKSRSNHTHAH